MPILKSIGRSFRCPGTFSPLPLSKKASAEKADKLSMDWIVNMGLSQPNTKRYSKIEKIQCGTCASMCAPHANQNEMLTIANFTAWFFIYDDDFVHCNGDVDELHYMASTIEQTINEYRFNLSDRKASEMQLELGFEGVNSDIINANVHTQCLSNVIETLYNGSNSFQIGSFMDSVLRFFAAHPYTLHNLKNEIVPKSDLYLKMRYLDIGLDAFMDACLASNALLNDMDTRLNEYSRLRLCEMKRLVNKHIMLVNDVFSMQKELHENDYHNMVLILMKENDNYSMEKALEEVMNICDEYVNAFESFEENLVFMETSADYPIAKAYMDFLKQYWIGAIMWHDVGTKRYTDFQ